MHIAKHNEDTLTHNLCNERGHKQFNRVSAQGALCARDGAVALAYPSGCRIMLRDVWHTDVIPHKGIGSHHNLQTTQNM